MSAAKIVEIEANGKYNRQANKFHTPFGEGANELQVAPGKYRILWSAVCPWAHRSIIVRKLLGLDYVISVGEADPLRPPLNHIDWAFTLDEHNQDPLLAIEYISQAYLKADPDYKGRPTVPAVVDVETGKVVNNDYHELTYQLETAWSNYHKKDAPNLFPKELQEEIRQLNEVVFHDINNGVYKAGFAQTQEAYEEAYDKVFKRLDELEERLASQRYLFGNEITDADVRLYVTLARFDIAYYTAFRVNKKRIKDYPNLWAYARDLYQIPGFGDTTNFEAIKKHYFLSTTIDTKNTISKILPKGPSLEDWNKEHGREKLSRK